MDGGKRVAPESTGRVRTQMESLDSLLHARRRQQSRTQLQRLVPHIQLRLEGSRAEPLGSGRKSRRGLPCLGSIRRTRQILEGPRRSPVISRCCAYLTACAPVSTFLNDVVESLRRRIWSGDLPGLQSRRFGPSRVEWWVRLPHASANFFIEDPDSDG